jgi:hypothetical protein
MSRETDPGRSAAGFTVAGETDTRVVRDGAIGLAVATVVALTVTRVLLNSPTGLPPTVERAYPTIESGAILVPALAAVVAGLRETRPISRIGIVAIGTFGALSTVSSAASIPASGAIVAGGALATAPSLRPRDRPLSAIVAGIVLLAVVVSLGSAMDRLPAWARSLGSTLALLGLAATPVVVRPDRPAWIAGGLAFVVVVLAGATAPFVTGAVVLVAGGVVGVPLLLVAAGAGGGVASAIGSASTGNWIASAGAVLLLAGGVPATIPRAVAVVFGFVLLVEATTGDDSA